MATLRNAERIHIIKESNVSCEVMLFALVSITIVDELAFRHVDVGARTLGVERIHHICHNSEAPWPDPWGRALRALSPCKTSRSQAAR